jgi:outer membrane protein OmpA-like peptidoglycan-associated protein
MMNSPRAVTVLAALLAAELVTACGPKSIGKPSRPGQALVVLLPDDDGTTGRSVVSNPSGSVNLGAARDSTEVTANRKPADVRTMSEADLKRIFGDTLSALPPAPRHFTLFFRFESDELTEESRALFPDIIKTAKEHAVPDVVVVGHTDTMGTQAANAELGLRRAMMIRNMLVDAGMDSASIEVTSHGEGDLLVRTPDETPEPRNRRVEIAVK